MFNLTGPINDIYLSRKEKNGGLYIFAFIHYPTKVGALKAIAEMNHMRLRGKVVFVRETKYRRMSDVKDTNRIPRRGDTQNAIDHQVPEERGETKKNSDTLNKVLTNDTTRSLVGGTTKAIDFRALKESVARNFPHVIHVREMGAYKALLTFDGLLNVEEAYTFNMNSLLQLFHSVWRSNKSKRSETRRVWLECFGVPLHAWSVDTFELIGGNDEDGKDSDEHQRNISTKFSDDVAITLLRPIFSTGGTDQAAKVIIEVMREEVEDHIRMVNSETILNEWSYDHLRHNQSKLVTYQPNKSANEGMADFVGYDEVDSEMTIP
ncbi:hypothetical protein AHAS_Ahas05G0093600 [Arachis hypogaea]